MKALPKAKGVPDGWSEAFPKAQSKHGHPMPDTRNFNARPTHDKRFRGSRLQEIEVLRRGGHSILSQKTEALSRTSSSRTVQLEREWNSNWQWHMEVA